MKKKLHLLQIKNEANPGKKLFWNVLEVIGWIVTSVITILILAFISDTHQSGGLGFLLIFAGIPFLISLMFRHFKNLYIVKEESMYRLQEKVFELNNRLEKANEEKRNLVKSSNNETIGKNFINEKECPMCAEKIKLKAKICRFCGHIFDEGIKHKNEQY